jgi:hypothetical protein
MTAKNKGNAVLIAIFALINGIVLYNALFHVPWIGYDATAHIRNIVLLSGFKLPTPQETYMFYMPPLSYFLSALIHLSRLFPFFVTLKLTQFLNVIYSVGLTFYLLKICDIIRPGNTNFKILSLSFLGMIPVYYKTFAFIRSEPMLAFLSVFAIYKAITIFVKRANNLSDIVKLGVSLGLIMLTRQTGVFILIAIGLFSVFMIVRQKGNRRFFLRATAASFIVALVLSGWFYMYLLKTYGTPVVYNVTPSPRPISAAKIMADKLFSEPIRAAFDGQFLPIFYSELWGDYQCYFIVYGKDTRTDNYISGAWLEQLLSHRPVPAWLRTNREVVKNYLGRVNLVSLLPSAVFLAGLIFGLSYLLKGVIFLNKGNEPTEIFSLIHLVVIVSVVGFAYFFILYPGNNGNNFKATYALQIFPFLSILAGEFVYIIKQRFKQLYMLILLLLMLAVLHNFPVFITRYVP